MFATKEHEHTDKKRTSTWGKVAEKRFKKSRLIPYEMEQQKNEKLLWEFVIPFMIVFILHILVYVF